jgi:hypothetical protein
MSSTGRLADTFADMVQIVQQWQTASAPQDAVGRADCTVMIVFVVTHLPTKLIKEAGYTSGEQCWQPVVKLLHQPCNVITVPHTVTKHTQWLMNP